VHIMSPCEVRLVGVRLAQLGGRVYILYSINHISHSYMSKIQYFILFTHSAFSSLHTTPRLRVAKSTR
jgi:hypothetical protein